MGFKGKDEGKEGSGWRRSVIRGARIQGKDRVQGVDKVLFELLSKDQTIWVLKIYIYIYMCVCGLD